MKKLAIAAAFTVAASTAYAGSMADPMIEEPVIVEETAGTSAGGIVVPLLLLLILAAVASN